MVRLYGSAPYRVVLVHGGPGAMGSLKGFAQELAEQSRTGVMEAIQSKYSIAELIGELYQQIQAHCSEKVSLAGHSWGAWLAALFAEQHPERAGRLILIGSAPLADKYVPAIGERRRRTLSTEDRVVFQRLLDGQAADADMAKMPDILDRSDNYCLEDRAKHRADRTDSEMYRAVWSEAARLRTSGALLASFQNIKCPICLIQGERDPHPAEGVTAPLLERGVPCECWVLEKCGHSPFMEKYAKKRFYEVLNQIMARPSDTGSEEKKAHGSPQDRGEHTPPGESAHAPAGSPEHGEEDPS